jgi:hypothetical protein
MKIPQGAVGVVGSIGHLFQFVAVALVGIAQVIYREEVLTLKPFCFIPVILPSAS